MEKNSKTNQEIIKIVKEWRPDYPLHRAFIGVPEHYDFIGAMGFNLLTSVGLRQYHKLLDIGCGSLRIGRLFIPYLDKGNYWGIEPNDWLIDEGLQNELGKDILTVKQPHFVRSDKYDTIPDDTQFDYMLAHSIFTHAPLSLVKYWLAFTQKHLTEKGVFVATFFLDEMDYLGDEWVYPGKTTFKIETIEAVAKSFGLYCSHVNWKFHVKQYWLAFSKYNYTFLDNIGWNNPLMPPDL